MQLYNGISSSSLFKMKDEFCLRYKIKMNGKAQEKNSEKHWPKDQLYNTNTSSYKYVWKGAPKKSLGRLVLVFDVIHVIKMWAPTGPP